MQDPGEGEYVVEDDAVGDKVVVLDNFALFVTVIRRNRAVATKGYPLREPVECLALIGRCMDVSVRNSTLLIYFNRNSVQIARPSSRNAW